MDDVPNIKEFSSLNALPKKKQIVIQQVSVSLAEQMYGVLGRQLNTYQKHRTPNKTVSLLNKQIREGRRDAKAVLIKYRDYGKFQINSVFRDNIAKLL